MITITVPLVPPSLNVLRRKYRNCFVYKKLRTDWEHSLKYAVGSANVVKWLNVQAKHNRMRVKVTIFHGNQYDPDNLVACLKPVLDSLRNIGFIQDDSEKWLELVPPQQFRSGERKTVVELGPA
jgi:hypothetical protein